MDSDISISFFFMSLLKRSIQPKIARYLKKASIMKDRGSSKASEKRKKKKKRNTEEIIYIDIYREKNCLFKKIS